MTETKPPRPLRYGEGLPLLHARANRNSNFALGAMGGRFSLLCVLAQPEHPDAIAAVQALPQTKIDEDNRLVAAFIAGPGAHNVPSSLLTFDDPPIARQAGLVDPSEPAGRWVLIDPSLRMLAAWPLAEAASALKALAGAPEPSLHAGAPLTAPVLIAPRVFEPAFCSALIDYYKKHGGEPSGVTKQHPGGKTYVELEDNFKRRNDRIIDDHQLRQAVMQRLYWRLAPEIEKAFMWRPTRIERYLVARYDAESGGFFRPHRDNTTAGTAHRRFAVTINLNADAYEGGDLRFPEFGARTYRAPTGGAVVFACSLLHEATPVTRGERFAFLPFLYDDAAAKVREANNHLLDESIGAYGGSGG